MQHIVALKEFIVASKNRVTINLAESELKELQSLSEAHKVSMALLGRQAVIKFLENNRKQSDQLSLLSSFEADGETKG